jgi:photosystem II stability/assembly factor-like uncharacterized protein
MRAPPHSSPRFPRRESGRVGIIYPLLAAILFLLSTILASATGNPPASRGLLLDAALNGHAVIAVGERGAIVRSVDSGETWESISTPTHATLTGISFANTETGWAVGHDGVILNTRDGGETWTEQFHTENAETVFLDVAAIDSSHAIAIGAFGVCYTTKDAGRNWVQQTLTETDNHLNRITAGPEGEFYVAGERGTLLRIPGFNKSPEPLASPAEVSFYGLVPVGKTVLLAYGIHGHIYRSSDGGANWQTIPGAVPALFATSLNLQSGAIVLAGQGRAFLVSRDDGRTFSIWEPPITTAVAELVEAPNGLILAFGEAGVTRLEPPVDPSPKSTRPSLRLQ